VQSATFLSVLLLRICSRFLLACLRPSHPSFLFRLLGDLPLDSRPQDRTSRCESERFKTTQNVRPAGVRKLGRSHVGPLETREYEVDHQQHDRNDCDENRKVLALL
jgi:hypothetical protein